MDIVHLKRGVDYPFSFANTGPGKSCVWHCEDRRRARGSEVLSARVTHPLIGPTTSCKTCVRPVLSSSLEVQIVVTGTR